MVFGEKRLHRLGLEGLFSETVPGTSADDPDELSESCFPLVSKNAWRQPLPLRAPLGACMEAAWMAGGWFIITPSRSQ
jgi:hypothetical protein